MKQYDFSRVLATGASGMIGCYVDFGMRTDSETLDRSHFPSGTALPTNESVSSKRCTLRPWQEALAEYVGEEWAPHLRAQKII